MIQKLIVGLWSDESGASTIELAVASVLILVPLLMGSTEIARRIWVKAQLDNAVRVGMEYVLANHLTTLTGPDLQIAAQSATSLNSLGMAVTVSPACGSDYTCSGCMTSDGAITTTCSNGETTGTYAGLTATVSYTPLFHACGGLLPETICPLRTGAAPWSSTAVARIQ